MNKKMVLIIVLIIFVTGCNNKNNNLIEDSSFNQNANNKIDEDKEEVNMANIKIFINNKEYNVNLENNETVKELIHLLPLEITMNELNGNEKYLYLDNILPTNPMKPKYINSGDIMLYGNNCLVIFYKSFETSYSYTKIGHIDDLPNLGGNSINVKMEK